MESRDGDVMLAHGYQAPANEVPGRGQLEHVSDSELLDTQLLIHAGKR